MSTLAKFDFMNSIEDKLKMFYVAPLLNFWFGLMCSLLTIEYLFMLRIEDIFKENTVFFM